MPRYRIEENAIYYVRAKNAEEAEKIFLNAISLKPDSGITCEIPDREIFQADAKR